MESNSNNNKEDKVVDAEEALERLDGDRTLLELIWQTFIDEASHKMSELRSALDNNDVEVSERLAHSIKGAAANIGAMSLKTVAFGMEQAAKKADLDTVRSNLPLLESEFQKAVNCLLELLKKRD
jgi:HPt (histidine-containing phosphotransfer) domain-containing protein